MSYSKGLDVYFISVAINQETGVPVYQSEYALCEPFMFLCGFLCPVVFVVYNKYLGGSNPIISVCCHRHYRHVNVLIGVDCHLVLRFVPFLLFLIKYNPCLFLCHLHTYSLYFQLLLSLVNKGLCDSFVRFAACTTQSVRTKIFQRHKMKAV